MVPFYFEIVSSRSRLRATLDSMMKAGFSSSAPTGHYQEPCANVGSGTEQALERRQRPGGHTARNLVRLQESELRGKLGGVDSKQEPVDVEGVLGELFLTAYIPILQAFPYLVHFRHQQCRRPGHLQEA